MVSLTSYSWQIMLKGIKKNKNKKINKPKKNKKIIIGKESSGYVSHYFHVTVLAQGGVLLYLFGIYSPPGIISPNFLDKTPKLQTVFCPLRLLTR